MAVAVRIILAELVIGLVLFGSAGRIDLPWFWALIAVHASIWGAGMAAAGPDLRRERLRPGPGARDPHVKPLSITLVLAHLLVAGLDVGRFGWTGPLPGWVQGGGLAFYAAGMAFSGWAMASNPFFSPVLRIQTERGHSVQTGGPYRYLRHPGYAGLIVASLSGGVALGSLWSLLPLLPFVALFVHRTANEDRTLRAELSGYSNYASNVRSRLIPGLW